MVIGRMQRILNHLAQLFTRSKKPRAAVDIFQLLGREPICLDTPELQRFLAGKSILVTGAGGSIGSEICRQAMKFCPRRLVLVERAENALFEIDRELRERWIGADIRPCLADICDQQRIASIFKEERPDVVFHCAAHKHVPLMEENPGEAVKNNVFGTKIVADAALASGCHAFVMVSTDKAVNPTSVMGACKRVAELFCQNFASESNTRFITVRFGNVLDSAGSVVPRFREQIRAGGPVTVTHPEITRYFMTIPEACQLILQAAVLGKGGEIFALDMGEPVRIRDLAEQMIRLAGKSSEGDIPIIYTGLRPGEKLFEELFHPLENYSDTTHAKIFLAQPRSMSWSILTAQLKQANVAVREYDEDALRRVLDQLLPELAAQERAAADVIPIGSRTA